MTRISISKSKLLAISIILLVGSASFYLGQVLGAPSPSRNTIVTPGSNSVQCTDYLYLDGTTPVDRSGTTGDLIVGTAGQNVGSFLNTNILPYEDVCFEAGTYIFTSPWIIGSNETVIGTGPGVVFQPGANNIDIMQFQNAGQSTNPRTINVYVNLISFKNPSGFTNVNGIDFNESINENTNHVVVSNIHFSGIFNYYIIGDGNEDSVLSNVYSDDTGAEISWKVASGWAHLDNLIYGEIAGSKGCIHIVGSVTITNSVINCVVIEYQIWSQSGSGGSRQQDSIAITVENTWLANSNPNLYPRFSIRTNENVGRNVWTMLLKGDDIDFRNTYSFFQALGSACCNGIGITNLNLIDNFISGNTAGKFIYTNGAANGAYWNIKNLHMVGNTIAVGSTPVAGDYSGSGFGTFYMLPEPVGFSISSATGGYSNYQPTLPAGTGSGNAIQSVYPWPTTIYLNNTSSAGTTLKMGVHIIDQNNVDHAVLANPSTVILYPIEKIYFATNVPYAWAWYGDQW